MRANDLIREFIKNEWIEAKEGVFRLTPVGEARYHHYLSGK